LGTLQPGIAAYGTSRVVVANALIDDATDGTDTSGGMRTGDNAPPSCRGSTIRNMRGHVAAVCPGGPGAVNVTGSALADNGRACTPATIPSLWLRSRSPAIV